MNVINPIELMRKWYGMGIGSECGKLTNLFNSLWRPEALAFGLSHSSIHQNRLFWFQPPPVAAFLNTLQTFFFIFTRIIPIVAKHTKYTNITWTNSLIQIDRERVNQRNQQEKQETKKIRTNIWQKVRLRLVFSSKNTHFH